jgi:hypothetical protein
MKKIATLAAATVGAASLMSGTAGAVPMPEVPHPWDKRVKCQTNDPEGRHIVTRYGNSDLGWYHFIRRHNIKSSPLWPRPFTDVWTATTITVTWNTTGWSSRQAQDRGR